MQSNKIGHVAEHIEISGSYKMGAKRNEYETALELGSREVDIDAVKEKKLLRKIDRRLMPLMIFTYALQYYDKSLMGQAAIFGMRKDLGLLKEPLRYSNASMIFYVGYIVGCYPMSYFAQRWPTGKVCAILCLVWSVVVLSTAGVTSYQGLMVNRVMLGFIESGISPSFMMVTSMWYNHNEQITRSGYWYSASGGSNLISPLINYGLGSIKGDKLHSWQYMYLVAGSVTALWSVVIWLFFPDSPILASGFTDEERAMVLQRVRPNNQGAPNSEFKWYQLRETLLSYQFWMVNLIACTVSVTAGPLNSFSSIIFSGLGFDTFQSLLLNMPIGAMALICINGSAFLGRRFNNARLWITASACVPVIVGCLLTSQLPSERKNLPGRLIGYYMLNFFSAAYTHCISLGVSNVAGSTKKMAAGAGIFVSYCVGNIIGPLLFPQTDAPKYVNGFIGTMVCLAVALLAAVALRILLSRENKRRDDAFGIPGTDHGLEDLTDKENKDFRYKL